MGSGGLTGLLMFLGMFAGAVCAGFIRYLMKTSRELKREVAELRASQVEQQELLKQQELTHRAERRRDANVIADLQNRIIDLLLVIAGLRAKLSEHGIATDDVTLDSSDK